MAWAMQDESVKVQMFRFIDVLPMLAHERGGDAASARVFSRRARSICPRPRGWGWPWPRPRSIAGRALAIAARRNAMGHARRFIAGTNQNEVLAAAMRERKLRRAFTLDILGEAVTSESEAERYLRAYLDLIEGIAPTVNAWPEVPQIDRASTGRAAARERLGQALGARQPVRSDRSGGNDATRGRAAADAAARRARQPGVRQRRHGVVSHQGPDAGHLSTGADGRRVSRHERRGHRHSVLSARRGRRICASCAIGPGGAAGRFGCGWSKGPIGTTKPCYAEATGWPVPVFREQVGDRRQLRSG